MINAPVHGSTGVISPWSYPFHKPCGQRWARSNKCDRGGTEPTIFRGSTTISRYKWYDLSKSTSNDRTAKFPPQKSLQKPNFQMNGFSLHLMSGERYFCPNWPTKNTIPKWPIPIFCPQIRRLSACPIVGRICAPLCGADCIFSRHWLSFLSKRHGFFNGKQARPCINASFEGFRWEKRFKNEAFLHSRRDTTSPSNFGPFQTFSLQKMGRTGSTIFQLQKPVNGQRRVVVFGRKQQF